MTAPPTVALTGASGFVGGHVLAQLLAAGHKVRALVRNPARFEPRVADTRLTVIEGSQFDDGPLARLVEGAEAVVHLVGIIMEVPSHRQTFERVHVLGTRRLIEAARSAGIQRWVQMSALGTRPDAVSTYHRTKWAAETAVRESGTAYTIFRPSIIHGPDGEFMELVKGFWCKCFPPFVPYFSARAGAQNIVEIKTALLWPFPSLRKHHDGDRYISTAPAGRLQPVWVEDVARCFTGALDNDKSIGETYPMGGPDVYSWPQLFDTCRRHLPRARNKKIVAIPAWYAKLIAGMPGVPFNRDQVIMSQEDSVCEIGKVQSDFEFEAAPFETTLAEYAGAIR